MRDALKETSEVRARLDPKTVKKIRLIADALNPILHPDHIIEGGGAYHNDEMFVTLHPEKPY